jgi:NAD(P)-dependent dehydrogenase (short-subunit alcohol dehydrogenase family)
MMNDGGGIVNISSGTTRFCVPGYSVYSSMKGAIEVFTRNTAKEFGARGIRSNVVAPGPVETDFNNAAIRSNPQMKNFLGSQTALGRVGQADDIGAVVAFLCTDEAMWINGQRFEVAGGINSCVCLLYLNEVYVIESYFYLLKFFSNNFKILLYSSVQLLGSTNP